MVDLQTTATWESAVADWPRTRGHRLLRAYADELNARLAETWLIKGPRPHRLLKTDLFDEAVGSGLYPCLRELADEIHGIDVSDAVVAAAAGRYPELETAQADVRRLPFADETFDAVVSCSTLDHFDSLAELEAGLGELARVLAPRGRLLVTLDNASNPLVSIRNAIPWRWLASVRLVPCYVGATCSAAGLESRLARSGLSVERTATLMHVPRLAVLGLGAITSVRPWHLGALLSAERLGEYRTRNVTAQFVAALAVKHA